MTFILKQAVKNTNSEKWIVDKNGVDLTKLIIEPLIEKVIEILKDFINECHQEIKDGNLDNELEINVINTLESMEKANSIIMAIKLKKLGTEILKYIAPYFDLKIDQIDSIK